MRYTHNGRTFFRFLTLFGLLAILSPAQAQEADLAAGENLFKTLCSTCHHPERITTGPALGPAHDKYATDKEWLYAWVKNAPGMIASGDAKAVALSETMPTVMTPFPTLSNEQIDNILAYAKKEIEVEEVVNGGPLPPAEPDPSLYYALLGLVAVLVLIAILLVVITATLITAVKSKEGEEPFTFADVWERTKAILQNKFVATAIATFIIVAGGAKLTIESRQVSLHEGYMPEQPIAFSHKLHAGELQVDCKYCHTGTMKSKNAWIPSANVCMNCHKYVVEGPTTGEEEIKKSTKQLAMILLLLPI